MTYPILSWVKFKDHDGVVYKGQVTHHNGVCYTVKVPGDGDRIWQWPENLLEPAPPSLIEHPEWPPGTPGVIGDFSQIQSDNVNHPAHYTWGPVEVIEITERLGFCLGNVVKYVLRADHKGKPLEDLKKARWYLDREITRREQA